MALGVHISNRLQPVLLFCCFRYNYHQFSLTVTKSSIITSYAFQFIWELLFNYCLLQYYYVVEQIFSATFTRVYQINGIKGLPYPCVHFTFIYRINEQSLAVSNQTLLPHPWHPLNGVVLNRTVRFWCSRQTHLVYPVWYYSHSIDVFFRPLYQLWTLETLPTAVDTTIQVWSSVLPAPCTIPCMQFCSPTGPLYSFISCNVRI